ncbi:Na-translocating system protein MpsC family protein [Wukongibacter sp. M2B1]|uniref:Na-translocating system protein MpsC family protein n=1 Tax=Wukongibacter sp. M2B1 TaxID=3088895 RepID=UPI003D79B0E1
MENRKRNLLNNLKVLYVEDEEVTRKEMEKFLKRRIGKLYLAENGKEGLEVYREQRPDIVIADLVMPIMGGMEMIEQIRRMDDICFIMITSALGDVDSILETVDIGIEKYIIKPIDTDKLVDSLVDVGMKVFKRNTSFLLIDKEKKKETEDSIKREISYFIKKSTGKGPKDVSVFIKGNIIEIRAYETLTSFEKSILDNKKNNIVVDQNRKLFYSIQSKQIEQIISKIIKSKVRINNVMTNSLINKDIIKIAIL